MSSNNSQRQLSILQFGCTPSIVYPKAEELAKYGVDSKGVVVWDGSDSYNEISRVVAEKNWDGLFVGYGVRGNPEWFEKVKKTVAAANPKVRIIDHKGISDLVPCVERTFGVKLARRI